MLFSGNRPPQVISLGLVDVSSGLGKSIITSMWLTKYWTSTQAMGWISDHLITGNYELIEYLTILVFKSPLCNLSKKFTLGFLFIREADTFVTYLTVFLNHGYVLDHFPILI